MSNTFSVYGKTLNSPEGILNPGADFMMGIYGTPVLKRLIGKTLNPATETVLTDSDIIYNLSEGEIFLARMVGFGIHTTSDWAHFEIGATNQANGAGTFTPLSPHWEYHTGTVVDGSATETIQIPWAGIKYSDGFRSITWRVDVNDTACEFNCNYWGYVITDF